MGQIKLYTAPGQLADYHQEMAYRLIQGEWARSRRAVGGGDGGNPPGRRRRAARRSIAVLPTLLTLGNLLCGFLAVFFASRSGTMDLPWNWTPLTFAAVFIFLGMLFDTLDGRVARMTRNTSDLGVQLDSMADMVTFGVAPAFLVVQLIGVQAPFFGGGVRDAYFDRVTLLLAAIYVASTALRLARFNVEVKSPAVVDHMYFKGLPSPGAAGTVASLILLHQHIFVHYPNAWGVRVSVYSMLAVLPLVSFAMVSRLRYVHLINRYVRGRAPFGYISKAVAIGLLMLIHLQGVMAVASVLYALSAPTAWVVRWLLGRKQGPTDLFSGLPDHVETQQANEDMGIPKQRDAV